MCEPFPVFDFMGTKLRTFLRITAENVFSSDMVLFHLKKFEILGQCARGFCILHHTYELTLILCLYLYDNFLYCVSPFKMEQQSYNRTFHARKHNTSTRRDKIMPIKHNVRDVFPFLVASSTSPLEYAESEATKQKWRETNNNKKILKL